MRESRKFYRDNQNHPTPKTYYFKNLFVIASKRKEI